MNFLKFKALHFLWFHIIQSQIRYVWLSWIATDTLLFSPFFPPVMLQVLYKLKTAKVFDRNRSKEDKGSTEVSDEDPFAIQIMAWCPESRMLCVAGVSANVIIYRFSKLEVTTEVVQVSKTLESRWNV